MILYNDWKLRYPLVDGRVDEVRGSVPSAPAAAKWRTFNAEDAQKIEIFAFSRSKTTSAVVIPIVAFIGALFLFTAPPPGARPEREAVKHTAMPKRR